MRHFVKVPQKFLSTEHLVFETLPSCGVYYHCEYYVHSFYIVTSPKYINALLIFVFLKANNSHIGVLNE